MEVWDTMPVAHLFNFAFVWIVSMLDAAISDESINLRMQPYTYLPREGYGFEIPLADGDCVDVEVGFFDSQTRRPSRPNPPNPNPPNPRWHSVEKPYSVTFLERSFGEEQSEDGHRMILESKSYDKIRQTFKCPKFTGKVKDWKLWDKGLQRYLSIWELIHVLDLDFFNVLPLTKAKSRDNKLVYYIIEDAVQSSSLATSYVRKAALNNGFEAYYNLMDGYVFAGATSASLYLNELTGFRFLKDESPTALVLRLEELFQDLEGLPGVLP